MHPYLFHNVGVTVSEHSYRNRTSPSCLPHTHPLPATHNTSQPVLVFSIHVSHHDFLNGYLTSSSLRSQICFFFLVVTCSTHCWTAWAFMNLRMKRGSHSSDAMPRSLQHRISAFDLHPSAAVDTPSSLKYCCSPRAWPTNLFSGGKSHVSIYIHIHIHTHNIALLISL